MCKFNKQLFGAAIYSVLFVLIGACSSNVISIDAKDTTSFRTIETDFPMSRLHNGRIKLRASRATGDYSQMVPDNKLIIIEGDQIWGPTDVHGTTELGYASISIGSDDVFSEDLTLDGRLHAIAYIGLSQTDLDLTLIHNGINYKIVDDTVELYWQIGLLYEIAPGFKAGGTYTFGLGPDFTGTTELDLRLDYALFKHLQIIGGYRWLEYDYLVDEDDSVVRVVFRGPFLGLNIPF